MEAIVGNWVASSSGTALGASSPTTELAGFRQTNSASSFYSFCWPASCSSGSLSRRNGSSYGAVSQAIVRRSRRVSRVGSGALVDLMVQSPEHAQLTRGRRCLVVAASRTAEGTEEVETKEVKDEPTTSNGASTNLSVASLLEEFKAAIAANDDQTLARLEAQAAVVETERDDLAKQVATLLEEANTARERLLRLNADFDNFRKRTLTEKANLTTSVRSDVVEILLPMVDNFERAKSSIKVETEGEEKVDRSYQGIYKQFVEIMKGLGVVAIETVGKAFDPNLHEAIMREDSSEFEEGVVVQEFRRGFCIGERLLRPAMVKVSAGPGPAKAGAAAAEAAGVQEGSDEGILDESSAETENAA